MRRSGTRNIENNKFISNLGVDSEKPLIRRRDCDKVAISNQFIWCLRLFKKVCKKVHDVKSCFDGLIAKKYPSSLCINLLSIF